MSSSFRRLSTQLLTGCVLALFAFQVYGQTVISSIKDNTPDSRYLVSEPTVVDLYTGLMWTRDIVRWQPPEENSLPQKTVQWNTALSMAKNSNYAGHSDWRLPNIKELATLISDNRYGPAINTMAFPDLKKGRGPGIWSSTPVTNRYDSSVYELNINRGTIHARASEQIGRVLLVRDTD